MKNPCKACVEYCMGLCWERIEYLEWYQEYCDKVRQEIRRVHGQEDIKAVQTIKAGTGDDRKEAG